MDEGYSRGEHSATHRDGRPKGGEVAGSAVVQRQRNGKGMDGCREERSIEMDFIGAMRIHDGTITVFLRFPYIGLTLHPLNSAKTSGNSEASAHSFLLVLRIHDLVQKKSPIWFELPFASMHGTFPWR